MARKAEPKPLRIADLSLPQEQIKSLKNIAKAAAVSRKKAQICLFVGPRGSGQTLVAQVLANELKQQLQRFKLPALIGESAEETERNLMTILAKAQTSSVILLFDEADALFGKRSEVKDSHDRYANLDTGASLAAMETYRGLVILCSNLPVEDDSALSGRRAHRLTFGRKTD